MSVLDQLRPLLRAVVPESVYAATSRAVFGPPPWHPGAALPAPRCPVGCEIGPPHFVGMGVQKAGTSWWHSLITAHPDCFELPRAYKERHFFARFSHQRFTDDDIVEYHRWFPRPPGKIAGEWTPDYLLHFWTPPLIARCAPDAKVLVLLRDPVERYRSGLFHNLSRGLPRDARLASAHHTRGMYRQQLTWLTQHVPRDQILVQQYEACVQHPTVQLAQTYRFLGLDDGFVPAELTARVNAARGAKPPFDSAVRDHLTELYRDEMAGLVADGWPIDLDLWPNFSASTR